MAGGLGRKVWTRETLSSAELQGYLQDQVVMVFASANARAVSVPQPQRGMVSYLLDVLRGEVYEGGAWVPAFYGQLQYTRGANGLAADANGWVTFSHALGAQPTAVAITPGGSAVQNVQKFIVTAKTSTQVSVIAYNTTNGSALANNPAPFDWVAFR